MVHYITEGKNRPRYLGTRILIGGLALLTLGSAYFGFQQYQARHQNVVEQITAQDGIERRLDGVLEELRRDSYEMERQYTRFVNIAIEGLESHPDVANKAVRESISALERSGERLEPDTYLAMFEQIREKAEQNPEIMDHFGPKALEYQENRYLRKYSQKLEEAFRKGREKLEEGIADIKENEYVRKSYNSLIEGLRNIFKTNGQEQKGEQ